jgi:RNase H-fold protein (predicted Holliday junction resolvase)
VFTRINSLFNQVQETIVVNLSHINRYETLSVEHTVKLWAVGEPLAPYDTFGKREQKSVQSVIDLISKFTTANVLLDDSALFGASVVRSLLSHKLVSEFS